ncbi:MAG: alanine racemase [Planctomycetota bacterium]
MSHERVWAEIDLDAITHNLDTVRSLAPGRGVIAIVKANAYGHGAVPVAWHLASRGVAMLGVGDSQEAIELRRAGISIPILILGAIVRGELDDVVAHDVAVTVHSAQRVRLLEREARRVGRRVAVHLKVDTGLARLGCLPRRAPDLARLIHASEHLRFEGLCTHFSSVSPDGDGTTARQLERFEQVCKGIRAAGVPPPRRHAAASAAILSRVATGLDDVRPGIALYGLAGGPEREAALRPALSLKTQVIFLKDLPANKPIGYGRHHVTDRRTRIATLPVGYDDGYAYRLGGRGEVLIRGRRAPVVGRVSMDYLTVDVGGIPGVSVGDEVVLMGRSGDDEVHASELAARSGTIIYEVLTRLGRRVERIYRGGAAPVERGFAVVQRPGRAEISRSAR